MSHKKSKHVDSGDDTDSEVSSLSDEGGKVPTKKARKSLDSSDSKTGATPAKKVKSSDGEDLMDLTGNKYARVSNFRNRVFVDIREFYNDKDSGKLKPGKKGIALNSEQWIKLKGMIADIDSELKHKC